MSEPTEDKPRMIRGEDPLRAVDFIQNARRLLRAQREGTFHQTWNEIFHPSKDEPTPTPKSSEVSLQVPPRHTGRP